MLTRFSDTTRRARGLFRSQIDGGVLHGVEAERQVGEFVVRGHLERRQVRHLGVGRQVVHRLPPPSGRSLAGDRLRLAGERSDRAHDRAADPYGEQQSEHESQHAMAAPAKRMTLPT